MNKFGAEAYQRFQMRNRLPEVVTTNVSKPLEEISDSSTSSNNQGSSASSLASLSPTTTNTNLESSTNQMPNQPQSILALNGNDSTNINNELSTALPSHLKLEFDKIKYLPDMVKTIKKRHSISEIEGSSHMVPPQILQKMLEKHHKNFIEHQQQQMLNQQAPSKQPQQQTFSKLNQIKEEVKIYKWFSRWLRIIVKIKKNFRLKFFIKIFSFFNKLSIWNSVPYR